MDGSKILLTERLRAEQRWPEASKRKDELVKSLRAEGMRRAKAAEAAWERIEAEYPPLEPTAPTPMPPTETVAAVDDETFAGLLKIVQGHIGRWCHKNGINVSPEASQELANTVCDFFVNAPWRC